MNTIVFFENDPAFFFSLLHANLQRLGYRCMRTTLDCRDCSIVNSEAVLFCIEFGDASYDAVVQFLMSCCHEENLYICLLSKQSFLKKNVDLYCVEQLHSSMSESELLWRIDKVAKMSLRAHFLCSLIFQDDLTQVLNRRFLRSRKFQKQLTTTSTLSGMLIDIDDFKKINFDYGHLVGDFMLLKVAMLLKTLLKPFPCSFLIRYGGDEFLILISEEKKLFWIAEHLRLVIAQTMFGIPQVLSGDVRNLTLTVSIGCGVVQKKGRGNAMFLNDLIQCADMALLHAKLFGKNKTMFKK